MRILVRLVSIILLSLLLIAGGVLIGVYLQRQVFQKDIKPKTIVIQKAPLITKPKPVPTQTKIQAITIDYNVYGFMPNIIHAPVGTTIIVQNTSGSPMYFRSLPNQPNQNPALNLGNIENNQTKSFVITVSGTWQFENAYESSDRGLLTTNPS